MNINATVFIQAFNFGLTYFFLKKILFKPIVERIQQKDAAKIMLQKTLKEKEQLLIHLKDEKIAQLQQFRMYLQKYYLIKKPDLKTIPAALSYQKNTTKLEQLSRQGTQLLVERVPHAC